MPGNSSYALGIYSALGAAVDAALFSEKTETTPPEPTPEPAFEPVEDHRSPIGIRVVTPHKNSIQLISSRTTGEQRLLGPDECRVFRAQMEKTAIYSGMTVLNYTILDNHFHLLLEIPMLNQRLELSEGQLLARIEILYGRKRWSLCGRLLQMPPSENAGSGAF